LFAIPSRLVVGPLGAAGTPAELIGISGALWWLWHSIAQPTPHVMRPQPVRRAMLVLAGAVMVSYIAAMLRPISMIEMSSLERGILILLSWLGVLLVATDGIGDRDRLDRVMQRLCLAGGLVGVLGIVQFATGRPFTDLIQIPGLTPSTVLVSVRDRDGFNRPSGTAIHPIEFGTALTVMLPICLHYAFHPGTLGKVRRWFPVVAMGLAIPLSISRSAILGATVVLLILLPTWTKAARWATAASLVFGLVGMFVLVPGFIGSVTRLFTGVAQDSSALSRSNSYSLAWEFISRAPVTGRGFLTFLPEYRILDNQYLGMAIDTGLLGVGALIGLFVTAIMVAWRTRGRAIDPDTRSLALSLTAAGAAGGVSFVFFDAFSFPQLAGIVFFVFGLIGALSRLASERS
jgi:O-antigen ligase